MFDLSLIVACLAIGLLLGVVLTQLLMRRAFREKLDAAMAAARAADQSSIAALGAEVREMRSAVDLHKQQVLNEQRNQAVTADRLAREEETVVLLRGELEARTGKLAAAQEELAGTRSTLEQLRLNGTDQLAAIAELKKQLDEERTLVARLRADLAAQEARAASAREEAGAANAKLDQLTSRLNWFEGTAKGAEAALEQARAATQVQVTEIGEVRAQLAAARAELAQRIQQGEALEQQLAESQRALQAARVAKEEAAEANTRVLSRLASLESQRLAEQAAAEEKLQLLTEARERMAGEFKLLAGAIMEENAKRFAEQSQTQIGTVIDPLRERLMDLHKKVEEVYVADVRDRTALREQVSQLVSLNQTLSADAQNLTNALRGSNKTQGNWGELILQRILEDAGLREGVEFLLQDSRESVEGRRQQPDVVVQLPEGRKIVIDAKVSLVAFERASSATTEEDRTSAVRDHVASIRGHIRGLSERRYEALYDSTLDFVVMFVPIEPAFMMAVSGDERLCAEAWDRNVLLVSPSTLLFVLRTVAYLWRQEAQSRNAREIADRGAALYDKLASFVRDLEEIGTRIGSAQSSYAEAMKKLKTGRGSVIRQAEMLKELGVKSSKSLPKLQPDDVDDGEAREAARDAAAMPALPA